MKGRNFSKKTWGRGMWRVACDAYDVCMVGWWAVLERVAFGG